jgi:hypothetical protein
LTVCSGGYLCKGLDKDACLTGTKDRREEYDRKADGKVYKKKKKKKGGLKGNKGGREVGGGDGERL